MDDCFLGHVQLFVSQSTGDLTIRHQLAMFTSSEVKGERRGGLKKRNENNARLGGRK